MISRERAAALGKLGEDCVAEYLRQKGYLILKRNWRDRYGEVDIIAEGSDCIAFVEVKTRSESAIVSGLEAVDSGKQQRIRNEALSFVRRLNTDLPPRLDAAEVTATFDGNGKPVLRLHYVKAAF